MVQTLAHNSTATLSVIRDYLVQKLQKQSQQIAQDELRVRRYREETTRIRQEIQELKARLWGAPGTRLLDVGAPRGQPASHRVSLGTCHRQQVTGVCLSISCLKICFNGGILKNSLLHRIASVAVGFGAWYLVAGIFFLICLYFTFSKHIIVVVKASQT